MTQIEQKTIFIMFYLISCVINDSIINEERIKNVDINLLRKISKRHSLSNIVYIALQKTNILNQADSSLINEWKESKEKSIRKNILLDIERKYIFDEMEKNHIWYMPLKGSVIKDFYPSKDMREMADNDILYDKNYQKEVKNIFDKRGYTTILYSKEYHDIYFKKPVYNFEMHTLLFPEDENCEFTKYFENVQNMLICDEDNKYAYHFDIENFYLYMIAHSYKHYINAGIGFRMLVDLYVVYKKFINTMNFEYVLDKTTLMGISNYEKNCRNLAINLFANSEICDITDLFIDEREILINCYLSGIYGTTENYIKYNLKKYSEDGESLDRMTKIKYCFSRLFPNEAWYKKYYPFLYKYKIFIPFFCIYRVIRTLFFNLKNISNEIKTVYRINE